MYPNRARNQPETIALFLAIKKRKRKKKTGLLRNGTASSVRRSPFLAKRNSIFAKACMHLGFRKRCLSSHVLGLYFIHCVLSPPHSRSNRKISSFTEQEARMASRFCLSGYFYSAQFHRCRFWVLEVSTEYWVPSPPWYQRCGELNSISSPILWSSQKHFPPTFDLAFFSILFSNQYCG